MMETSENLTSLNIIFKTKTNPTFIPHRLFLKVLLFFFPNPTFIPQFSTYLSTHKYQTYNPTFIPHKISQQTISHINPTFQIKNDVVYFCRLWIKK